MADNSLQQQIVAGATGQVPSAGAPMKSTVAADVAAAQVASQKKDMLAQAQEIQQKQKQQMVGMKLASNLSSEEMKQRENTMLQKINRQISDIHMKLGAQRADLASEENIAQLEQLSFLNNLSNRKWANEVRNEGAKRRLDNANQMKEALLYANFDDMMSMLNSDMEFKKAMNADDRAFNEYLATIGPMEAIQAAIQMQKDEQAGKAVYGAVKGVTEGVQQIAQSGYFTPKVGEAVDIEEAQAGGAGSGVLQPEYIKNYGVPSTIPSYTR